MHDYNKFMFKVESPGESATVQKMLFKNGYQWCVSKKQILRSTHFYILGHELVTGLTDVKIEELLKDGYVFYEKK